MTTPDGELPQDPVASNREASDAPAIAGGDDDSTARSNDAPALSEIDESRIRDKVARTYELVPGIGTGRRWYDLPYRLVRWMLTSSRPRRLLHWRLRSRLNIALNYLITFNHYERLKVKPLDDPMDNLIVPADEEITQGGIWVVEFFPPSCYSDLTEALTKNGWDEPNRNFAVVDGTNAEKVTRARRGHGFEWSRMGAVADPRARYPMVDAKREVLPEEFRLIELTAVQLGQSLTAVTAFFRLSDAGKSALNTVWKAQHEPIFEWRGLRLPHTEGRHFAAIRAVQRERKRLHDLARSWLAERCPGFFAATKAGHPVVDFNMFAKFDPTSAGAIREFYEPLRALGMGGNHVYNYISPQLPGAVMVRGDSLRPAESEDLHNCWGVVGAYEVFADQCEDVGYGEKPYSVSTLGAMSDDAIRAFLLNVAVVRYTEQLSETFSDARDTARRKHREFKPKNVEKLRHELLTTSLDLPVVARDTASLWEPAWRRWNGIEAKAVPIPGDPFPAKGFDLIKLFERETNEAFEQLMKDDIAYRDVLATAAALGASTASTRLGRRALFVSGVSLLVSILAVLAADHAAAWHQLLVSLTDLWRAGD